RDNKIFYSLHFVARVMGPDNKLIFSQQKDISKYLDASELERIKKSSFGYDGWLALAPGKYKVEFVLTNKLNKTAYKADRDIVVPGAGDKGVRLSQIVAFSNAEAVGPARDYLPFTVGGVKFTPITGDALTYSPGQNVNIFYQIWGPPTDPNSLNGKKLSVDYAYGRLGASGDSKTLHEEVGKEQFDAFGSLLTGKKISLAPEAGQGNYRLMVSVSDPDSPQKVYSSLNFRVFGTPGSNQVFDVDDPDLADDVNKGVPDFDRALCSMAQGDSDSAIRSFKIALNRDPGNEITRARLAELYYARHDYADVAGLFSRTPITSGTDEQAILQGAESMAKTGSVNHAISLLESAISIRKSSGPLYLALA